MDLVGVVLHELLMVMSGMGVNGTIKRDISGYERKERKRGRVFCVLENFKATR